MAFIFILVYAALWAAFAYYWRKIGRVGRSVCLAALFPGIGQVYNRRTAKAFAIIIVLFLLVTALIVYLFALSTAPPPTMAEVESGAFDAARAQAAHAVHWPNWVLGFLLACLYSFSIYDARRDAEHDAAVFADAARTKSILG